MHEYCKQCVEKKHDMCTAMNLEEAESLDGNNNDLEVTNEGNVSITNEQRYFKDLDATMMHHCDEGNTLDEEGNENVFNECHEFLEKNRMKETHQKFKILNF